MIHGNIRPQSVIVPPYDDVVDNADNSRIATVRPPLEEIDSGRISVHRITMFVWLCNFSHARHAEPEPEPEPEIIADSTSARTDSHVDLPRSLTYTSPEQYTDGATVTKNTDIWQIGVLFLELLGIKCNPAWKPSRSGEPIKDEEVSTLLGAWKSVDEAFPEFFSTLKALLSSCLNRRTTATGIVKEIEKLCIVLISIYSYPQLKLEKLMLTARFLRFISAPFGI